MKKAMTLVLAVVLLAAPMVLAQQITVGSVGGAAAVVPGAGTPPVVEYLWVLPDEDNLTPETQVDVLQAGQRDDIYACLVTSDVEGRDTIIDTFVDVYHPDGSFKYQIHAVRLDIVQDADKILDCADDAVQAGLITPQDFDDITYNIFDQQNWYMWEVWLPMFYHQPAGDYTVEGYAVDSTSLLSAPTPRLFTWVAGTFLALDFNSIDFGNIQPGAWKILNGDLDFTTSGAPTLRNEGNVEIQVGLEFSEFVGQGNLPNKKITRFDAQLRNLGTSNNWDNTPGEHLEFNATQQVTFQYPIELCRQEKLDLSIHADIGTVPDSYAGTLTIFADGVPTNDWGELDGNPGNEHAEYGPFPRCGTHMDPLATCPLPLPVSP